MENFADNVTKLCIEKYESLKKSGKPSENEWTVLSGVLIKNKQGLVSLVSLATGTKCLGGSAVINLDPCEAGCRLSDSHAEVLARRAFLRFLYDQVDLVLDGSKSSIFTLNDKRIIELIDGISFHYFTSQMPCGDCSIFPKSIICNDDAPPAKILKINDEENIQLCYNENGKIVEDTHRTGAKCLAHEDKQDPLLPGADYHVVGPLRTKPGRGDPTMSLSCSDKMAKWNLLGVQGALLSLLVPEIKFDTITVGNDCPFSLEAMKRGLCKRFNDTIHDPIIMQAKFAFPHRKGLKRKHPCPSSIIWCAVNKRETEIAVEGRKQGMTKKQKKISYLLVTKRAFLERFLQICDKHKLLDSEMRHPKKITYYDCKQWSTRYQNLWRELKSETFCAWPNKPVHIQQFVL